MRFPSLRFPSLRFPSLRFPSLRFPSLRFPSLRFPLPAVSVFLAAVFLALAACQPPAAVLQVRTLLDQGRTERALDQLKTALKRHPDDRDLHRLAIRAHLLGDDRPGALSMYRRWERRHGEDRDLQRHLSLAFLRWGLGHRDPALRLAALQGARATDAAPLEQDVADRLLDPDEVVRTWAAVALSATPRGADTLEQQLVSRSDRARAVAVENLGRIAKQAALSTLARYVTDPAARVRSALARALIAIKTPKALTLLGRLTRDKDREVRTAAVTAIGRLGLADGARHVRRALADPYLGLRLAAVLALSDLQGSAAKETLRAVATGGDLSAALHAGLRLAQLGEVQPVLNAIAKSLVDRSRSLRAAACNTAGSVNDRVALRLVKRALRDPQPLVRMAAARATLARGDRTSSVKAAHSLRNLACSRQTDEMESLCLQAVELLARSGQQQGMRRLITLATDARSAPHRISALTWAMSLGAPLSLPAKLLADRSGRVAIAAAIALYRRVR